MNFELAITLIGPIVLVVNIVTMFLCFRPKYGLLFTILVFAVCAAAIQFIYNPIIMRTAFAPYGGVIIIPVMMLLFRGQPFQKLFAFFRIIAATHLELAQSVNMMVSQLIEGQLSNKDFGCCPCCCSAYI